MQGAAAPGPSPAGVQARARYEIDLEPGWEDRFSPMSATTGTHNTNGHDQREASQVDQLESDSETDSDEEYFSTTAATRNRAGVEVPGLLSADQVLPVEEFGEISVKELYRLINEGTINLNPAYQRESVWMKERAEGLIESIFRNVHIPELLFNVYTAAGEDGDDARDNTAALSKQADPLRYKLSTKGKEVEGQGTGSKLVWNCADGKQRCTSIRKFVNGEIMVKSNPEGKKKRYQDLSPAARAIFDEKKLRFGFYRELSYPQECEIFKRVQLGVKLTSDEAENACTSDYKLWIDSLINVYSPQVKEQQCSNPEAFSPRIIELGQRNKSLSVFFCLVSSLVLRDRAVHRNPTTRLKELDRSPLPPASDRQMVERILARLKRLTLVPQLAEDVDSHRWPSSAHGPGDPRSTMDFPHRVWRIPQAGPKTSRALSPVEIMFIPLIIQKYEQRPDGDLLEIIEQVRQLVSVTFPREIKDNVKVWNVMRSFLDNYDLNTQLKGIYNDDGSRASRSSANTPKPGSSSGTPRMTPAGSHQPSPRSSMDQHAQAIRSSSKRPLPDSNASQGERWNGVEQHKKRKTAEEVEAEARERARLEQDRRHAEEQERLRQAAEARRRQEEEELERRRREEELERRRQEEEAERERVRIAAQQERERRMAEVKEKRLARERELAESADRARRERDEFDERERARQAQAEIEKLELERAEREELERIMSEAVEDAPPTRMSVKLEEGEVASGTGAMSREDLETRAAIQRMGARRNVPEPLHAIQSPRHFELDDTVDKKPIIPRPSSSNSTSLHWMSQPNNSSAPLRNWNPSSAQLPKSQPIKSAAPPLPRPPPPPPPPAPRVFSGAKARLADQILGTARIAPPAPAAPTWANRKAVSSTLAANNRPIPRKKPTSVDHQTQNFDARGRLIRPEQTQYEIDEIEAVGGRGDNDIVFSGAPIADHSGIDDGYASRMDSEVMASLSQRQGGGGGADFDHRDREVQEHLFAATRPALGGGTRRDEDRPRSRNSRDRSYSYERPGSSNGMARDTRLERWSVAPHEDREPRSYRDRDQERSPGRKKSRKEWDHRDRSPEGRRSTGGPSYTRDDRDSQSGSYYSRQSLPTGSSSHGHDDWRRRE